MCRINLCCCCCSLRIGTYLSAAYTLVLGFIGALVAGVAAGILTASTSDFNDMAHTKEEKAAVKATVTVISVILYVALAIYILWIITGIVMIVGTAKSQRGYLIPWLVMTIILTILSAIQILMGLINLGATFATASSSVSFILSVTLFCLNCYALTAVMSFYKDNCIDNESVPRKNIV